VRRASPKYLAFTVVGGTYLVTPTLHARLGVEVQHAMVFRFLRLVGNRKQSMLSKPSMGSPCIIREVP